MKMSAKETKALVDIGTTMAYSGDELKQFVRDERMRIDKEKKWKKMKDGKNLSLKSLN